jgi:hypothetical protein
VLADAARFILPLFLREQRAVWGSSRVCSSAERFAGNHTKEIVMTRKFALAALAAAALAAGPMFATEAAAKDNRRTNAAIGIAAGIGGLLIGSAIANAQPRYQAQPGFYAQPRGYGHVSHGHVAYDTDRYDDEEECFEKPIRRVDHYTGRVITVGSKTVCR